MLRVAAGLVNTPMESSFTWCYDTLHVQLMQVVTTQQPMRNHVPSSVPFSDVGKAIVSEECAHCHL